jgi:hypothetical protein
MVTAAASIMPAYMPILLARKDTPYTPENHRWQQLRHGRCVVNEEDVEEEEGYPHFRGIIVSPSSCFELGASHTPTHRLTPVGTSNSTS